MVARRVRQLFGSLAFRSELALSPEYPNMAHPDHDDPREMARRAIEWLKGDEGRCLIKESERRVKETEALLEKGREIDPAKLHEPFTK
jgi:hypothetical protein